MSRSFLVLITGLLCIMFMAAVADAGCVWVATAKNLRGALYLGAGPTPAHASEMAIVKCSQDSVIPMTCKVCTMRKECPPPKGKVRKLKPIRKYRKSFVPYSQNRYSWGRPMQ